MILKQELGKNIKFYRKCKRMTQEELADLIGIDSKNVSKIENGINFPSTDTLTSIAKVLGVNFYELFVFENPIPYDDMKKEIIEALEDKNNIVTLFKALKSIT